MIKNYEPLIVCTTKEFEADIKEHGAEQANQKLKSLRSKKYLEELRNMGFMKLNLNRSFRLIAKDISEYIDSELRFNRPVILFLRMYQRENSDYRHLYADNISTQNRRQAKRKLEELITPGLLDKLRQKLKEYKEEDQTQPPLPTEYLEWLHQIPEWNSVEGELGVPIYESQRWRSKLKERIWRPAFEILGGIAFDDTKENLLEGYNYYAVKDDIAVLYGKVKTEDKLMIYLITPLYTTDAEEIKSRYEEVKEDNDSNLMAKLAAGKGKSDKEGNAISRNEIASNSCRAYPADILLDYEQWENIEDSTGANLALSGEEKNLLSDIMSTDTETNLPVFINGRAGSGKSTMLLYLLASYLDKFLSSTDKSQEQSVKQSKVLYLTYNRQLLEQAKKTEQKILTSHHTLQQEDRNSLKANSSTGKETNKEIRSLLENTFYTFHDILFDILPLEKRKK